jgi:hypothetical protein
MGADATFYTIADARFFPGVVALLNSLRLTGNHERLVVLDVGLTQRQRALLAPYAQTVDPPPDVRANPFLSKPLPYRLRPSGVLALIDSDVIVTRSLAPELRLAAEGRIALYPDHAAAQARFFPEWAEIFALRAPLRRETYMGCGLVALSADRWLWLLERWWEACGQIPEERHFARDQNEPVWAGDQDAFNALLMSEAPRGAVAALPPHEVVLWDALRATEVNDERTLACRRNGRPTAMLHYSFRPKPWERRAWLRITDDAFVRLLPRVLFAEDLPLRLGAAQFPIWVRPGRLGRVAVRALDAAHFGIKGAINAPPAPVRRRLVMLRNELFYRLGR